MLDGTRHQRIAGVMAIALLTFAGCGEQPAPPTADVSPRQTPPPVITSQPSGVPDIAAGEPPAPISPATEAEPLAVPTDDAPVGLFGNAPQVARSNPPATEPAPSPPATGSPAAGGNAGEMTPAPSANSGSAPQIDEPEIPFAERGSLEFRLFEITQLIVPPPILKEVTTADGERTVVERTQAELEAERKTSLKKVVRLAGEIIASTHADADQETLFNHAVHYLCVAHMELALAGEASNARQLSETAEAIYAAKPASSAAVESSARLVELAQRMGERFGTNDVEWVRAHATQARLFASRFPLETSRCVTALLDAGRACERVALHADARHCYQLLSDKFGDTPFADAVAAVLRRMNLEGTTLAAQDFAGATIDGDFLTIEQYRGKHVLVVFWTSDSPTFEQDFSQLQTLQQTHGEKLAIVGVNLDRDELAVDRFLEAHPLTWRQVFDPDPARRGTANVIATYYGVATVPMYWLIDPNGKVLAAPAELKKIQL